MRSRLRFMGILGVLLLTGCGQSGTSSAHDLVHALHCQPTGSPTISPDGYTLVSCIYQGRRLAIYWRDAKITTWPGESWSREELWGSDSRWNIDCATHDQCVSVQSAVGGHFSNTVN